MNQDYIIKNQRELEDLFGSPKDATKQKVVDSLDDSMASFIAKSPLIFISTIDSKGRCDISPKGDAPGFVVVDETGSLLIPERPGNKLMFGFNNLLNNPNIGVIFVVPATRETLRVKGTAVVSRDPEVLDRLSAQGKPALLFSRVEVKECFFHCGKAMIRSKLWEPECWGQDEGLMIQHFAQKHGVDEEVIESGLEESYTHKLY